MVKVSAKILKGMLDSISVGNLQVKMKNYFLIAFGIVCFGCQQKRATLFVQDQPIDSITSAFRTFNQQKIASMQDVGINDQSAFALDFYFDTNDSMKAQRLSDTLEKLDNHLNRIHRSARDQMLWVLSGSSHLVSMNESNLGAWTDSMCRIGFHCDCGFIGWNPVSE
jgi:Regulator of ribonuclease activity B